MTASSQLSRAGLLAALRASEQEVLALGQLPPESFEQGRYENGWTARQILAHLASMEWTYPRLIDLAREAASASASAVPDAVSSSAEMRGGHDAYNARQVAKREQTPVPELLAEFQRNRAATIAAVEAVDEALLTTPIRSAGGRRGSLAAVLHGIAVEHVRGHARDIRGER